MSVKNLCHDQTGGWNAKDSEKIEPKYCPKVRMGNWNEELALQEEKIKYFLRKKEKGQLLIQKTRATFANLCKEIELLLPGDYCSFANLCQVLCAGLCHPRAPEGLVLAGVVGTTEVDTRQHFHEGSLVSASPLTRPCVRNCFKISSPDGRCRDGDTLKFGEPFALATAEYSCDLPLYVESEVPHLHSILGQAKHPLLRLSSYKNIYSLWRVMPVDHSARQDLWDTPVPANIPVVISHVASNKNLALEPTAWFTTYFGIECEVSVHTDLNIYRRETENNVWVLVTNRSQEQH